jgi:F0F1-type ATP synthase delta subunit
VKDVKVVSALPLTAGQREKLHTRLKEKLGKDVVFHERVERLLVAGVTITVGSMVFDGTLASKISRSARKGQEIG